MSGKASTKVVAYLRTSSAANIGADKDSETRQREAVGVYARTAGLEIVETYYDAAVSGADPITTRPGFSAMLERLLSNGVRAILVETASRFARDLIVQETGYEMLKARGIDLIAVDSPESFVADTPTANLIRQVLGAVAEFEKAMLVEKLRGARERKRVATGKKVGGRKNYAEIDRGPEMIALSKKLHRYPVNGRRRSLADIAEALERAGFVSSAGTRYTPTAVSRMLASRSNRVTARHGVDPDPSSTTAPDTSARPDAPDMPTMGTPLGSRW
ncbi:recombinase family protein [Mesorhizobium sp. ESP-6-2]|uniref:recombinase family protein n=1 Tax=Mesorhizobium sp. ESP-6-2 TaxID=2876625 RepID=UPI001CCDA7FE|nr:recombinase family protein [Mesorhizobium sp. ESP-6-2]MBZ9810716.1 recombinase family protein [Mesorhizobium sp. ESP-6-2]